MANNSQKLLLRIGLPVLVLAAALYYYFGWSRPEALVAKVIEGTATDAVSGSVTVGAEYAMEIRSDIGGRVAKTYLELDKRVKAGDLLVKIDDGDLLLDIERSKNEYEATKKGYAAGSGAALELAASKEALANAERQYKSGIISDTDMNNQKRSAQAVQMRYDQEQINRNLTLQNQENGLRSKQRQLEKMSIRAPFDGIVTQVYVHEGDLIGTGAAVGRMLTIGRLVEARLSEENIAGVRVGQKAYVSFLPYDIQQFDAKVTKVMSSADPETQRYPVHLSVEIDPAKLVPGITGEVSIIIAERPSKTIVPRRALFGDNLYIVKDGVVELRTVKTGFVSMTAVEILEGVANGEWVIVDQLDQFHEGKRVRAKLVDDPRWR